jgi:hypothetical protein
MWTIYGPCLYFPNYATTPPMAAYSASPATAGPLHTAVINSLAQTSMQSAPKKPLVCRRCKETGKLYDAGKPLCWTCILFLNIADEANFMRYVQA